jgi:hypothetical protein
VPPDTTASKTVYGLAFCMLNGLSLMSLLPDFEFTCCPSALPGDSHRSNTADPGGQFDEQPGGLGRRMVLESAWLKQD